MTVLHFFTLTQVGDLGIVNNLLVISKDQIDKAGNSMTCTGNGNESVMEAKIDPFIFIIYDENSILINFLIDWYYISDLVNLAFEETRFLLVITISNIVKY